MQERAIIPKGMEDIYQDWRMSPALVSGDFVFLTGFNGAEMSGYLPQEPERQIRAAFEQVASVLDAGGMTFANVVEMTSYHVGLQRHIRLFRDIHAEFVREPYPAWTAVGISELATPGALVELRVIARLPVA